MEKLGYCPSCMKEQERFGICSRCVKLRDKKYEHSEKDIQDQLKKDIDNSNKNY